MCGPFLLEIRPHRTSCCLHYRRIFHRRGHADRLVDLAMYAVLQQLAQYPPQRLAGPSLGNNGLGIGRRANQAAERGDGADLGADELLDLGEELGVVELARRGGEYESKGKGAFEGVWDGDDAGF